MRERMGVMGAARSVPCVVSLIGLTQRPRTQADARDGRLRLKWETNRHLRRC